MDDIDLDQFYNFDTLNIFTDASIIGKTNYTGCCSIVAVVKDEIIDRDYKLISNTTSNNAEIKGIRCALDIALKYRYQYKNINIFCDSLISVNGLKSYIYKWRYNKNDGLLYTSAGKPAANQEIFIESFRMLKELEEAPCIIQIWHQSGHVDNSYSSIRKAADCFGKFNNVYTKIDYNFIRYISVWNNYVDNASRSLLKRNTKDKTNYIDPLIFYCQNGKL